MNTSATLVAELALLSEVLDDPSADIATTLSLLVSQAERAVPSYLGLSVLLRDALDVRMVLTTFENNERFDRIETSLRFTLEGDSTELDPGPSSVVLLLFAAQSGAFVDLAADLAWLTGQPLGDIRLDLDLRAPELPSETTSLRSLSTVNQALGMLIGDGLTVEQAGAELHVQAANAGVAQHLAAERLLANWTAGQP